ncbi:potassium channel family protein [Pararhodobacter sp. CCB-MM2]|uniref:potassium channel family protein n=1 Tax=Pararhodobacter sp. CCB-MM2 TaxID=1786003 RepID=UPI0009F639F6|nr:potassium channel family protein [Pararhodobacter sp. CCB-MM2]
MAVRQASLRHRIAEAIDPELHQKPGLSPFNRGVVAAILLLILIGVLETEVHVIRSYGGLMTAAKALLFIFFLIEYLLRLWVSPLNPKVRGMVHFALKPASLLDLAVLISLASPFLGLEAAVFRLLQLLRILRLARLGRYSRGMNLLFEALRSRSTELMLSALMAFSLMLGAATLLYIVEGAVQPQAFGSIPRALWWAVETLTTVGYGDVVPVTPLGRVLAALTALCGIGFIALPTGLLAGAFSDAMRRAREDRLHPHHDPHD